LSYGRRALTAVILPTGWPRVKFPFVPSVPGQSRSPGHECESHRQPGPRAASPATGQF